jgi:hypothetical protein
MKQRKTKHLRFVLQWNRNLVRQNKIKLEKVGREMEVWKRRSLNASSRLDQLFAEKQFLIHETQEIQRLRINHSPNQRQQTVTQTPVTLDIADISEMSDMSDISDISDLSDIVSDLSDLSNVSNLSDMLSNTSVTSDMSNSADTPMSGGIADNNNTNIPFPSTSSEDRTVPIYSAW